VSTAAKSAHRAVRLAVQAGELTRPQTCTRCGSAHRAIHGHHEDYSRPLDVIWLCTSCHRLEHAQARLTADSALLDRLASAPMLLTFTGVAELFGISLPTVRRLISAGKLTVVELDTGTSVKPSRRVRRTDLADYVRDLERA
jgi:excisionase family DNA binding protein